MSLKLHNAMWPGLVGKGDDEGQEPPISLERMLELSAGAEVDGQKFDGIDYFLFHPHTDPEATDDQFKEIADLIASHGFNNPIGIDTSYSAITGIRYPQIAAGIKHHITRIAKFNVCTSR